MYFPSYCMTSDFGPGVTIYPTGYLSLSLSLFSDLFTGPSRVSLKAIACMVLSGLPSALLGSEPPAHCHLSFLEGEFPPGQGQDLHLLPALPRGQAPAQH